MFLLNKYYLQSYFIGGLLLLLIIPMSIADDPLNSGSITTDDNFCRLAQQLLVDTNLESDNQIHQQMESFIKSKAKEYPLVTQQYVNFHLTETERLDIPVSVSCKLKTAERINNGLAESANTDTSKQAKTERSCEYVNKNTWQAVLNGLTQEQKQQAEKLITFDNDDNTVMGPFWLRPFPYQVAYKSKDGLTHIRGKSLHVEYSIFIPMPAHFKGTHYCHLISAEYLRALSLGELTAPALQ